MTLATLLGSTAIVHPSALPGWNDCPRREAAKLFPGVVAVLGYKLRHLDHHVGGSIGTGVHASAAHILRRKMEGRDWSVSDALLLEAGHGALDDDISDGVIWDSTTPTRDDAEFQLRRMVTSYRIHLAPKIDPIAVEQRLEGTCAGLKISGKKDVLARLPGGLRDLKTGKMIRANGAQYGTYSMIERAHGGQCDTIIEDHLPRARVKAEQPRPIEIHYDVGACEQEADATIRDIRRSLEHFNILLENGGPTPPEQAFRANPNSMLCSDRFCPVHSTPFCRAHLKKDQ